MRCTIRPHTTLYYQVSGQGPNVLFLHGNGEDHHIFDPLIDQMQANYTCYAIDTRQHGLSSGTAPANYLELAEDIHLFIEQLSLDEVIIVGFSDGAIIGTLLAIDRAPYLIGLVAMGLNLNPQDITPRWQKIFDRLQQSRPHDPWIQLMSVEPNIPLAQLQQIQIPTLIIAGDNDILMPSQYEQIADTLHDSELHIVKQATHDSYIVDNDLLAPILTQFIRTNIHT